MWSPKWTEALLSPWKSYIKYLKFHVPLLIGYIIHVSSNLGIYKIVTCICIRVNMYLCAYMRRLRRVVTAKKLHLLIEDAPVDRWESLSICKQIYIKSFSSGILKLQFFYLTCALIYLLSIPCLSRIFNYYYFI